MGGGRGVVVKKQFFASQTHEKIIFFCGRMSMRDGALFCAWAELQLLLLATPHAALTRQLQRTAICTKPCKFLSQPPPPPPSLSLFRTVAAQLLRHAKNLAGF
jgi:hypothetical protein